ncbi:GSCFA domain-containing protein [Flavobacterium luteum]|uniref:GSCFA domain-containing protein n=1 Tax=Flavobacterium luteum TaxID=2026654 RepID=A0A7J5AG92_9FLAO|nr:GSCFA domain-containing protein [Flavobacterium luteum]KAB1156611.1 GSCFA domain-containing protein [Flavobacterium luteum]
MNFTTKVSIPESHIPIDYNSNIVSLGSCFAESMAVKFEYFKFQNIVNPFGIIFNPVSIEKVVSRAINHEQFTEKDIFFHNERWHCYEVHSDLSTENKEEFLNTLNSLQQSTHQHITESTHIIITFGTSWIYKLKATNEAVANCHKAPQNQFDKEILSVETITKSIQNTIDLLQKTNPNCTIIFTISPVRHIKDGFVENQRSKAHLITAIHQIIQYPLSIVNYFPSYEILLDELRDYRFYAEDMLHPSQVAIDYIWERFTETWISELSYTMMAEVDSIQKGLAHRPFNPNSESHIKFADKLKMKITKLVSEYPLIKF